MRADLSSLKSISITRGVILSSPLQIELHAFSDASEQAYATVIYLRSVSSDGSVGVKLVRAKTKAARRKSVSLSRLELCVAFLLAHLVQLVTNSLQLKVDKIYAWTDSTVVLPWLSSEPRRWQTFVSNGVLAIHQIVPIECWNHIQTKLNPADCASRGLSPSELVCHDFWWHGPDWLSDLNLEVCASNQVPFHEAALSEERKK